MINDPLNDISVLPMNSWNDAETLVETNPDHETYEKAQSFLKGEFFPYELSLKYKELLPMLSPFGIGLQGDKIKPDNCFYFALEQWNKYAIEHPKKKYTLYQVK